MACTQVQALLHEFIDVVEWKEDPADPRREITTIKIFEENSPGNRWRLAAVR
jgi:hypothetical protein